MKVGIRLPQTGKNAKLENIKSLAKDADEKGFDSLWVLERLLWPISPRPGENFPSDWQEVLEPLELLTFVAAITDRIKLGTSVIDIFFHNPVILAKRFATLDLLSGGRAIAGLGIGWSRDEFLASNIPMEKLGKRADEYIRLLKSIWSDEIIEYYGQFYNVPPSKIGPKPIQKPSLPIYFGGSNPNTFSRMAKFANGWIGVVRNNLDQLKITLSLLNQKVLEAEKNPDDFEIILIIYPSVKQFSQKESRIPFSGSIEQVGNDIERLKEMNVGHIILNYNRSPIQNDMNAIIKISQRLLPYIRT
jgi:probable F420-dependent oxidoreductase